MNDAEILTLLLCLNQDQLRLLRSLTQEEPDANIDLILSRLGLKNAELTAFEAIQRGLRRVDGRLNALLEFVANLTEMQVQWILEVQQAVWLDSDWSSQAHRLFHDASALYRISDRASYAIVAASMSKQGFPVPRRLAARLRGWHS